MQSDNLKKRGVERELIQVPGRQRKWCLEWKYHFSIRYGDRPSGLIMGHQMLVHVVSKGGCLSFHASVGRCLLTLEKRAQVRHNCNIGSYHNLELSDDYTGCVRLAVINQPSCRMNAWALKSLHMTNRVQLISSWNSIRLGCDCYRSVPP